MLRLLGGEESHGGGYWGLGCLGGQEAAPSCSDATKLHGGRVAGKVPGQKNNHEQK